MPEQAQAQKTCQSCGYNLPHHGTRCPLWGAGLSPAERRVSLANMSDADTSDTCDACGRRFGYAKARIDDMGRVVHRDLDCTHPGVWS